MIGSIKLKVLAGLLLRAMVQEQAGTGTDRVYPRDPNVARRLGLEPGRPELSYAESYLVREDYIRPSTSYHKDNSFTITETGWEDFGYQATAEGWKRKAWWRRMLGV
jgi:hypothetical protein